MGSKKANLTSNDIIGGESSEAFASRAYQLSKANNLFTLQEIDWMEELTGIDAAILRLKFNLSKEGEAALAKYEIENTEFNQKNVFARRLSQLIEKYKQENQEKRSFWRRAKLKPVVILEAAREYLANKAPEYGQLETKITTALIYETYGHLIQQKIDKIKRDNHQYNEQPFYKKLRGGIQPIAHLEAAKAMIDHARAVRSDLLHPSGRLQNEQSVLITKGVPRVGLLRGMMGKGSLLKKISNSFLERTRAVRKHFQVKSAKIAEKLNMNPLVRDLSIKDSQAGIVQFNWVRNVPKNSFLQLKFPDFLQGNIDEMNTLIEIRKTLGNQSAEQMPMMDVMKKTLGQLTAIIDGIANSPVDQELTTLRGHAAHLVGQIDIWFSLTEDSSQAILLRGQIITLLQAFIVGFDDVSLDKFLSPPPVDKPKNLANRRHLDNNKGWRTKNVGEIFLQNQELGKMDVKRAYENVALLKPTAHYARDDFANELVNSISDYAASLAEGSITRIYPDNNFKKPSPIVWPHLRKDFLINSQLFIKTHFFACAADYKTLLSVTKDMNKQDSSPALLSMGGAIDKFKKYYDAMMLTFSKQRSAIDLFLLNFNQEKTEYESAFQGDFSRLGSECQVFLNRVLSDAAANKEALNKFNKILIALESPHSPEREVQLQQALETLLHGVRPGFTDSTDANEITTIIAHVNEAMQTLREKTFYTMTAGSVSLLDSSPTEFSVTNRYKKLAGEVGESLEFMLGVEYHGMRSKQAVKYIAGQCSSGLKVEEVPESFRRQYGV